MRAAGSIGEVKELGEATGGEIREQLRRRKKA